ncbi:unnamed protein product [Owenia fusiformis]|uniref:Uncharacterized protein n=1 Tax=Owenia fusiformis TaxID=6347 RepID=A0A8J1UXN6_OWEFU|nr:unnamed protein product [Owenia fusiformis]
MVRLTIDLIARGTSGYTKKKRDESMEHFLKKITHLYLEDRGIDEVGDDLSLCRNLTVLYLYDNKLAKVPNLSQNANLTHLYLQNNEVSKMECFANLRRLTKLYIGGNAITVVEGIERLEMLQELHIENQRLPSGEKLLFDPRSLAVLSRSLQVLNVSGNNLDTIRELQCLTGLTQFMANDNQLRDLKEIAHLLETWRRLWRLELADNPICHKPKYKDRIIIMSNTIEVLDGKEITDTSRQFLRNWAASKLKKKEGLSRGSTLISNGETELPPVRDHRNRNDVPGFMMPGLPKKQFEDILARSSSLPNSANKLGREETLGSKAHSDLSTTKYISRFSTSIYDRTPSGAPKRAAVIHVTDLGAGDSIPIQLR